MESANRKHADQAPWSLLVIAAALIPFTGLLMLTSDASLMWLMAISFFVGLFALVGGAFMADKAARE